MSTKTDTLRVRISPGIRMWQALLVAAALVASLLFGLVIGRGSAPADAEDTFTTRDTTPIVCIGHIPKRSCESRVGGAHENTAPAAARDPDTSSR